MSNFESFLSQEINLKFKIFSWWLGSIIRDVDTWSNYVHTWANRIGHTRSPWLTLHVVFSIQRHLNCSWIGLKLHNGRMPLPYRTSRYPAQKLGPSFPQRPLSHPMVKVPLVFYFFSIKPMFLKCLLGHSLKVTLLGFLHGFSEGIHLEGDIIT